MTKPKNFFNNSPKLTLFIEKLINSNMFTSEQMTKIINTLDSIENNETSDTEPHSPMVFGSFNEYGPKIRIVPKKKNNNYQ